MFVCALRVCNRLCCVSACDGSQRVAVADAVGAAFLFLTPLAHVCFVLVFVLLWAQFALVGGSHAFWACRVCEFAGARVLTVVPSEQSLESVAMRYASTDCSVLS